MRWAEFGLFLAPLALYAAWRLAARWSRPSLLWGAWALAALLVASTLWLGLSQRMDPHEIYVPAQWQNGRVVPGHAAP